MVEVYSQSGTRDFSDEFLGRLQVGWLEVFQLLKKIGVGPVAELEGIEITLLDDEEMARQHGRFLNDETTTDVITFDHGELLIGVQVAARQALEFRSSEDGEIALYGIHGMLHLAGYDDRKVDEAKLMKDRQEELLGAVFADLS